MKVADLARELGMSVEALVATILDGRDASTRRASGERDPASRSAVVHRRAADPQTGEPRVAGPGRGAASQSRFPHREVVAPAGDSSDATIWQVHEAVDRWLLAEALERNDGNISHTARELAISRKRLRDRWAQVRGLDARAMARIFRSIQADRPPPTRVVLRAHRTYVAIHDEVDRWLLEQVFQQEHGNVTHAAQRLDICRRALRERRARLLSK